MPPSRRSSSSRSSRSRSSSSGSRSRSSSSRRHSSSSHSSSYRSSNRSTYTRAAVVNTRRSRSNQPTGVPSHIKTRAVLVQCKNHDYMYYNASWRDEATGVEYQKGYYDEDGRYYDADSVAFKKPDGSYEAHYKCDFCGTELEANWKEGFYPTCKNCGAEMQKTPVYIDEIVNIGTSADSGKKLNTWVKALVIGIAVWMFVPVLFLIVVSVVLMQTGTGIDTYSESSYVETQQETNPDIYGDEIFLDEVSHNTYRICTEQDEYEKHITWDYGAQSYYDYDSDCYLWYNTDVSPNLWQYWYEDIAGSDYYGWMECEGDDWYIEVSDTEWEYYGGDTSQLWHIENSFDEGFKK